MYSMVNLTPEFAGYYGSWFSMETWSRLRSPIAVGIPRVHTQRQAPTLVSSITGSTLLQEAS